MVTAGKVLDGLVQALYTYIHKNTLKISIIGTRTGLVAHLAWRNDEAADPDK